MARPVKTPPDSLVDSGRIFERPGNRPGNEVIFPAPCGFYRVCFIEINGPKISTKFPRRFSTRRRFFIHEVFTGTLGDFF